MVQATVEIKPQPKPEFDPFKDDGPPPKDWRPPPVRKTLAESLHAFADWLEENPDVKIHSAPGAAFIFARSREQLAEFARQYAPWEKDKAAGFYTLRKSFGNGVALEVCLNQEKVCQRVVTGTRQVTRPKMVQEGTETVTVDIVEWHCPPSILRELELDPISLSESEATAKRNAQACNCQAPRNGD